MATHVIKARHQQKIDTTANWHAQGAMILRDGEIGIERKEMGGQTAYLLKVGDGATAYTELPYLQAVAADVYAWAKNVNLVDGVLATYTLDDTKQGNINADDTLMDALNKIENAIATAISSGGETNQPAYTTVKVGDDNLVAAGKTDTLELEAGANVTLGADALGRKVRISANHPTVVVEPAQQGTLSPGFGDTVSVVSGVERDSQGHITGLTQKDVTLPELPEDKDTVTKVGITSNDGNVTIGTTPAHGDLLLGDAAARTVAGAIPQKPDAVQSGQLPTLEAVKTYADGLLGANDAMVFKGTIGSNGTTTSLPTKHDVGWTYRVSDAGVYAGHACEIGDLIICVTKGNADNGEHWTVAQTNVDGVVTAQNPLSNNALLLGKGRRAVATLSPGEYGQVLKIGDDGPEWANEVTIAAGSGIKVTGSAEEGLYAVAINNVVSAKTAGLYSIAHNTQGLITASEAVTSIPADMLADGEDTLVFYAGTSTDVI